MHIHTITAYHIVYRAVLATKCSDNEHCLKYPVAISTMDEVSKVVESVSQDMFTTGQFLHFKNSSYLI